MAKDAEQTQTIAQRTFRPKTHIQIGFFVRKFNIKVSNFSIKIRNSSQRIRKESVPSN